MNLFQKIPAELIEIIAFNIHDIKDLDSLKICEKRLYHILGSSTFKSHWYIASAGHNSFFFALNSHERNREVLMKLLDNDLVYRDVIYELVKHGSDFIKVSSSKDISQIIEELELQSSRLKTIVIRFKTSEPFNTETFSRQMEIAKADIKSFQRSLSPVLIKLILFFIEWPLEEDVAEVLFTYCLETKQTALFALRHFSNLLHSDTNLYERRYISKLFPPGEDVRVESIVNISRYLARDPQKGCLNSFLTKILSSPPIGTADELSYVFLTRTNSDTLRSILFTALKKIIMDDLSKPSILKKALTKLVKQNPVEILDTFFPVYRDISSPSPVIDERIPDRSFKIIISALPMLEIDYLQLLERISRYLVSIAYDNNNSRKFAVFLKHNFIPIFSSLGELEYKINLLKKFSTALNEEYPEGLGYLYIYNRTSPKWKYDPKNLIDIHDNKIDIIDKVFMWLCQAEDISVDFQTIQEMRELGYSGLSNFISKFQQAELNSEFDDIKYDQLEAHRDAIVATKLGQNWALRFIEKLAKLNISESRNLFIHK